MNSKIVTVAGIGILTFFLYDKFKNQAGTDAVPTTMGSTNSPPTSPVVYNFSDLFGSGQSPQPTQVFNPIQNTAQPTNNLASNSSTSSFVAPAGSAYRTTTGQVITGDAGRAFAQANPNQGISLLPSANLSTTKTSSNPVTVFNSPSPNAPRAVPTNPFITKSTANPFVK